MNENELENRLTSVENKSKSNTHRIDKLENITAAIYEMSGDIKNLIGELKHTNENISDHEKRLDSIEKQPADKYNKATTVIFTAICTGIVGTLVGAVLALVLK